MMFIFDLTLSHSSCEFYAFNIWKDLNNRHILASDRSDWSGYLLVFWIFVYPYYYSLFHPGSLCFRMLASWKNPFLFYKWIKGSNAPTIKVKSKKFLEFWMFYFVFMPRVPSKCEHILYTFSSGLPHAAPPREQSWGSVMLGTQFNDPPLVWSVLGDQNCGCLHVNIVSNTRPLGLYMYAWASCKSTMWPQSDSVNC